MPPSRGRRPDGVPLAIEVVSKEPRGARHRGFVGREDVMSLAHQTYSRARTGRWAGSDDGRWSAWSLASAGLVVVLLLGIGLVGGWRNWLPSLSNPFAEQVTDRSQPALLRSMRNLSRFTAASGDFQLVIDVERSRRFIPDVILGERMLFVAAGTVDAYVEFAGLAGDAIEVTPDGNAVTVTLPAPELAPPNIDHERSYLFAQERGVANRISEFFRNDPAQYQQVLQLAEQRIAEAAEESELRGRAAENTQRMLEGMLTSLGFGEVTVIFLSPDP